MRTQISSLSNGLRVVTTEMPSSQSVSVNIFVGTGSRYESRQLSGASHYLEHVLFKGTEKRPQAIMISEAIEGAGGRSNAFTSHELTCYLAKVPYDKLPLALDVISDMLLHSLLDTEEVERERQVIIEEIRRTWDHPGSWAGELVYEALFGDQPLGWSIAGTEDTVKGISRQDLADYVATWYVPNNSVVSVAGNLKHEQVVELAEQAYGNVPTRDVTEYPSLQARGEENSGQGGDQANHPVQPCDGAASAGSSRPRPIHIEHSLQPAGVGHELSTVQRGAGAARPGLFRGLRRYPFLRWGRDDCRCRR